MTNISLLVCQEACCKLQRPRGAWRSVYCTVVAEYMVWQDAMSQVLAHWWAFAL
jgi:hypothetical protein